MGKIFKIEYILEEDNGPFTYVKKSNISGLGLFASKNFSKDEIVIDYKPFIKNFFKIKYCDLNEVQINKNWLIKIDNEYCFTNDKYSKFSYLNHSRNPNCACFDEEKTIKTIKFIKKDEELFIDYRKEFRPNRIKFPNWI